MGEVRGHPPCAGHGEEGHPPPPIKGHPFPPSFLTPPCEGSLSPSRIIPPWSRISEIHVPGGISSGRSCCFRWIAGARRWRLSGGLNVCASADALLSCGARTAGLAPAGRDEVQQVWLQHVHHIQLRYVQHHQVQHRKAAVHP